VCAACAALLSREAKAIRPFVTDDARVVGDKLAQLETWVLVDRLVLEHHALAAIGPTDWLELTLGVMHGGVHSGPQRGYSITGPLIQAKALLVAPRDNGWPGVAVAVGAFPPVGYGPFTPPGWSGFAYLAITESLFGEDLLLHANVGTAIGEEGPSATPGAAAGSSTRSLRTLVTTGFGFQVRVLGGMHGLAEIYYGDPFDPQTNFPATQVGFRHIFSEQVQIDGTFGSTLRAIETLDGHRGLERWGTLGLRLVTPELW
jgi:hypothetical protein